jgi:hypothetical protein
MYPWALVRAEPEATLFGAAVIALAVRRAGWAAARPLARLLARPLSVVGGVFLFLVAGQLMDGAPTHHVERTLLPIWTALILVATELALRLDLFDFGELTVWELLQEWWPDDWAWWLPSRTARRRSAWQNETPRIRLATVALVAACVLIHIVRPTEIGAARGAERAIGAEARRLVPAGARLAVDTADYGYFAVMAAFEAPDHAVPIDDRDPRTASRADPFASSAALASRVSEVGASWLVVRRQHLAVAKGLGEVAFETADFGLVSALR